MRRLPLLLALIPPLTALFFIKRYGFTMPYWDQWGFMPVVAKAQAEGFAFTDVWEPHGEHRLLFPKLIMLALASAGGWNLMHELYVSFLLACAGLGGLYLMLRISFRSAVPSWLPLAVSLVVFSPAQQQNWQWSWQLQIFLCTAAVTGAVLAASRWPGKVRGFLLATAGTIVASYSFAAGLFAWFAIWGLLALDGRWSRTHRFIWPVMGALVMAAYFTGLRGMKRSLDVGMRDPVDAIGDALAFLGLPLGAGSYVLSVATGGILLIAVLCLAVQVAFCDRERLPEALPWLCLALFSILSCATIGVARVHDNTSQLFYNRYATISLFLPVSVLVLSVQWLQRLRQRWTERPGPFAFFGAMGMAAVVSFAASFAYWSGVYTDLERTVDYGSVCLENMDTATDDCLAYLFAPEAIRRNAHLLGDLGFLRPVPWEKLKRAGGGRAAVEVLNDQLHLRERDIRIDRRATPTLTLGGWAADHERRDAGRAVYLVFRSDGEEIVARAWRETRPDVARFLGVRDEAVGWNYELRTTAFRDACYRVSVRLLRNSGLDYFEHDWDKRVCFH